MLVVNELFIEIHKNHPLSSAQLRFGPVCRGQLAASPAVICISRLESRKLTKNIQYFQQNQS